MVMDLETKSWEKELTALCMNSLKKSRLKDDTEDRADAGMDSRGQDSSRNCKEPNFNQTKDTASDENSSSMYVTMEEVGLLNMSFFDL